MIPTYYNSGCFQLNIYLLILTKYKLYASNKSELNLNLNFINYWYQIARPKHIFTQLSSKLIEKLLPLKLTFLDFTNNSLIFMVSLWSLPLTTSLIYKPLFKLYMISIGSIIAVYKLANLEVNASICELSWPFFFCLCDSSNN